MASSKASGRAAITSDCVVFTFSMYILNYKSHSPGRDSFQHSFAKNLIQLQLIHMNITDVATAGAVDARRFTQDVFKPRLVDVADDFAYEMAAAHRAVAVHRDDRMAAATGPPQARMVLIVDREERIDLGEAAQFSGVVIIRSPFVGVDPQINARRQFAPQGLDLFRVLFQTDDADAEARAATVEFKAFRHEALARNFGRMVGRPQRELALVTPFYPIQPAGEVGLDRGLLDVRQPRQFDESAL